MALKIRKRKRTRKTAATPPPEAEKSREPTKSADQVRRENQRKISIRRLSGRAVA
jgi:hypothetical protein